MFRRITVGLTGRILRVASVAEVAARLLLLVGGAPCFQVALFNYSFKTEFFKSSERDASMDTGRIEKAI